MRLTCILLLAFSLHLSAKTNAQQISIDVEKASMKEVFKTITKQTGYQFVYMDEWLTFTKAVNITVRNATLQQVLDLCFSGQPYTYQIVDKMVVMEKRTLSTKSADEELSPPVLVDVHGRVTDFNGNPLAGVTIIVRSNEVQNNKVIRVVTAAPRTDTGKAVSAVRQGVSSLRPATDSTGKPVRLGGTTPVGTLNATGGEKGVTAARPATASLAGTEGGLVANVSITDANGEFTLKQIPEDAVLVFSHVGYETLQLKLDKRRELSIRLSLKAVDLKNVSVTFSTGYQTLSGERATGSFGKPDMQVFSERTGTQDLISRLEGLVPGVTVLGGSTSPVGGTTSPNNDNSQKFALIRGSSSVSLASTPLYVVDGVIVPDFNSINLDDVADITVLKDAAAAAIWGAKAANGVIVVSTKEGARGQKIKFGYSAYIYYQGRPDFSYNHQLNSKQFIQAAKETFDPVNYPWGNLYNQPIAPHEQILYDQSRGLISASQAESSLDSLASINNTQQIRDLFFRNALTTNHTLSASGGNSFYSFYSSLGYTDVQSNRPGQTNNTYKFNLSQTLNANKNITLSLNTYITDNVFSGNNNSSFNGGFDNTFLPYQLFKDAAGNHLSMPYLLGWTDSLRQVYQAKSGLNLNYSPLDEVNLYQNKGNNLTINMIANADVKIWKGLGFKGTYGYLSAPSNSSTYDDGQALDQRKQELSLTVAGSPPTYYYPTTGGLYSTTAGVERNWTVRNQLVYNLSPRSGRDQLTLQGGQEAQENFSSSSTSNVPGYNRQLNTYPSINYGQLNQGIPGTITSTLFFLPTYYYGSPYNYSEARTRQYSYFGLGSYTFDHKYSLDLSWRQDHSNLFGHDISTQNKPIWSVGGKWQLGRESFMTPVKAVNDLALRTTYGITGNSPYVGAASLYDILYPQPASQTGAVAGDATYILQPGNYGLTWETTKTWNIGIDYAVLKRRLSGSIDLYNKHTNNLINTEPLNPLTGFLSTTGNLGTLTNKGIELSIRSTNIQSKNFSWTTVFLFSYNKNKLLSYGKPNPLLNSVSVRLQANTAQGYSRYPIFAYRYAGLDSLGDPRIKLSDKTITKDPNAAQLQDLRYMGTAQPPFNGSLANTFTYKSFSLAANMIYNMGAVMRRHNIDNFFTGRLTIGRIGSLQSQDNLPEEFLDRWKKPGDEKTTNIPSFVSNPIDDYRRNEDYYTYGDLNVVSASYIKIRDLTFSYAVKPSVLRAVKAQALNFYVQATNFMVWKANHNGIDPEFQNVYYLPFRHTWSFGANLSF